jgi:hydrogenase maturation protease
VTSPRVLVAGIGNIFLGDDAFGVEVVRRLAERPLPEGVRVVDFGIRGFDLACALLDGYDGAILVDALQRGYSPGTLCVLEPDLGGLDAEQGELQAHGMHPVAVLRLVRTMGGQLGPLRVVGCEPATFGSEEDPAMGLSPAVEGAVEEAVRLVETVVRELIAAGPGGEGK